MKENKLKLRKTNKFKEDCVNMFSQSLLIKQ